MKPKREPRKPTQKTDSTCEPTESKDGKWVSEPLVHDVHFEPFDDLSERPAPPPPPLTPEGIEKIVKDRITNRIEKKRAKKEVIMPKTCAPHNVFTHFPRDPIA